jgi:hypothetical protein
MAEAAVHIVDGEVAPRTRSGAEVRFHRVPVHTVGSGSGARGRNPGGDVAWGENPMLPYEGCLVSPRDRGSWSLLERRLGSHRLHAATRYTAAGVRYPSA